MVQSVLVESGCDVSRIRVYRRGIDDFGIIWSLTCASVSRVNKDLAFCCPNTNDESSLPADKQTLLLGYLNETADGCVVQSEIVTFIK